MGGTQPHCQRARSEIEAKTSITMQHRINLFLAIALIASASAVNADTRSSMTGMDLMESLLGEGFPQRTADLLLETEPSTVRCPSHSSGANVASGCTCDPGFSGHIGPTTIWRTFWWGGCRAVRCPPNSSGPHVAAGCVCNAGFS